LKRLYDTKKKTITCEEREKKQNNNNNNEQDSSSPLFFLSSESDVINIKMSLVDFQLFLLLFPRERENKDASSFSLHVMTFGMYVCVYICASTSSVSHESAIINRHILVQQKEKEIA